MLFGLESGPGDGVLYEHEARQRWALAAMTLTLALALTLTVRDGSETLRLSLSWTVPVAVPNVKVFTISSPLCGSNPRFEVIASG